MWIQQHVPTAGPHGSALWYLPGNAWSTLLFLHWVSALDWQFMAYEPLKISSTRFGTKMLSWQYHHIEADTKWPPFRRRHFQMFLAATKQLYEWYFLSVCLSVCLSVRPSVCPSHLFDYVPIIVSSWNFQDLSPRTRVTSMQKVKVRGQRSRSQRSRPNLTVSGL